MSPNETINKSLYSESLFAKFSSYFFVFVNVHSSIAIILMGKRELVALLNMSSWCLVMVEWLLLAVPSGCLRIVTVVFSDHTHLLFLLVGVIIERRLN